MTALLSLRCPVCRSEMREWYATDIRRWIVACVATDESDHSILVCRKRRCDARRAARRVAR